MANFLSDTVNWMSFSSQRFAAASNLSSKLKQFLSPSIKGLSTKERRLLLSVQRQIECIIPPLQYCMLWARYRDSVIESTIRNIQEILLSVCSIIQQKGGAVAQMEGSKSCMLVNLNAIDTGAMYSPQLSKRVQINLYAEADDMTTKGWPCFSNKNVLNAFHDENMQQVTNSRAASQSAFSPQSAVFDSSSHVLEDLLYCANELNLAYSLLNLALNFIHTASIGCRSDTALNDFTPAPFLVESFSSHQNAASYTAHLDSLVSDNQNGTKFAGGGGIRPSLPRALCNISPTALLKATRRSEIMRGKSGDISICVGRLYYRVISEQFCEANGTSEEVNIDRKHYEEQLQKTLLQMGSCMDKQAPSSEWKTLNASDWYCLYPSAFLRLCRSPKTNTVELTVESMHPFGTPFTNAVKPQRVDVPMHTVTSTRHSSGGGPATAVKPFVGSRVGSSQASPPYPECYGFSLSLGMYTFDEETDDSDLVYIPDPEQIDKMVMGVTTRNTTSDLTASNKMSDGVSNLRCTTGPSNYSKPYADNEWYSDDLFRNHMAKSVPNSMLDAKANSASPDSPTNQTKLHDYVWPHRIPPDLAAAVSCRKLCFPLSVTLNARLTTESVLGIEHWRTAALNTSQRSQERTTSDRLPISVDRQVMIWSWAFPSTDVPSSIGDSRIAAEKSTQEYLPIPQKRHSRYSTLASSHSSHHLPFPLPMQQNLELSKCDSCGCMQKHSAHPQLDFLPMMAKPDSNSISTELDAVEILNESNRKSSVPDGSVGFLKLQDPSVYTNEFIHRPINLEDTYISSSTLLTEVCLSPTDAAAAKFEQRQSMGNSVDDASVSTAFKAETTNNKVSLLSDSGLVNKDADVIKVGVEHSGKASRGSISSPRSTFDDALQNSVLGVDSPGKPQEAMICGNMSYEANPIDSSAHSTAANDTSPVPPRRYVVYYGFVFDSAAFETDSEAVKHWGAKHEHSQIKVEPNEELTELDFMYLCRLSLLDECNNFESALNETLGNVNEVENDENVHSTSSCIGDEIFSEVLKNIYLQPFLLKMNKSNLYSSN